MITLIILAITAGISFYAMNNDHIKNRYMFNAYAIAHHREWWRFFSHGVLHADFMHLLFNMISLYFFGTAVEKAFQSELFFGPQLGSLYYILLYVGALPVSCLFTFFREKNNRYYNALGASGAVSAAIYAAILLSPLSRISFFFFPMPAWLFGLLYLVVSWYMARRNIGNIGHDAHFWGAVYGFLLPVALMPELLRMFIFQLEMFFRYGGIPQ
jgi:membrane associated rhomboid family serine protease